MNSVFLIPSYLTAEAQPNDISEAVKRSLPSIRHYLVENVRTARRFISSLNLKVDISQLQFEVLDKNAKRSEVKDIMNSWKEHPIGIMSEAGLPGLADPGSMAVSIAHETGRQVIPLPGASAIQTALICSGLDGQRFTFHGYAPIDESECVRFLKSIESKLQKTGYTQLFMDTPYRNIRLFKTAMKALNKDTCFSVAADLFGKNQFIKTQKIHTWLSEKVDLHKQPAVFGIGVFPS